MNKPKLLTSNLKILNIYTDGGARGNPGPAAIGVVIKNKQNKILYQFGRLIGTATNNMAEYQAVIAALKWLIANQSSFAAVTLCHFHLDSTLVVNQLNGLWKIKTPHLRQLIINTRQLEGQLGCQIKYTAIPRDQNTQADILLNQALDQISPA